MNDDRVIRVLEEIRDLQRQHVENYKEAIRNQQESIELSRQWQAQAQRRLKIVSALLIVVAAAFMFLRFWR